MPMLKKSVLAIALAFPVAAMAQSTKELKKEVEELKARIQQLERLVEDKISAPAPAPVAAPAPAVAPAPAPVAETVDPAEFNRIRVKVEAMEDAQETTGFKGLKFSGFIDPTYIYNRNAKHGGVQFLNQNFNGGDPTTINDFGTDIFSYDNSYFGGVTLKFEKEFDNGVKAMATLRPRRSVSNTYDFGNLFEEALVTIPFSGLSWRAIAGQVISWNGYEYVQSDQKKTITSNLLLDFAGPGFVTGAGVEYLEGKWWVRTMLGNLNTTHDHRNSDSQGLHWRVDYSKGEFSGWGASGMHGQQFDKAYNYLEADGYFTRGDLTLMGQVEGSNWKDSGFNGGDTGHVGVSGLAAWKFTPRLEGVIRADWFDNHRGGGGTPAITFGEANADGIRGCPADFVTDPSGATQFASCGDLRNGFGPGMVQSGGVWVLGDPNKGAKRSALTLGLNYQLYAKVLLKSELRYDRSNLYSFQRVSDGSFSKDNLTFGVQTVVGF